MSHDDFESLLQKQVLLPILRMNDAGRCLRLAQCLSASGFALLEITLDTPEALRLIAQLSQQVSRQGGWIGAGTVLTAHQAEQALAHGARFLVSPGLSEEVAAVAAGAKVPYLPGVFTPTEVTRALALNLQLLKLFPAQPGGLTYFRHLKGPFARARWLITGGVELNEIAAWRQAGALAVGYGTRIVEAQDLAQGNWEAIEIRLRKVRAGL